MQCSSQISVFMRSDEKKQPPRQKTFLNTSIRTKQKPAVTKRGFLHEFKWFEISNRDMEILSRKAFNDFLHVHLLHAEKLPSLLFRFNWCWLNHYVKIRHWMPCPRESSIKAKMISSVSSAFSVHRRNMCETSLEPREKLDNEVCETLDAAMMVVADFASTLAKGNYHLRSV